MNTLKDFCPGMRVRIIGARYHAHMIGQTGTVKKAVKRSNTVWVIGVAHNGIIPLTTDRTQHEYSDTALFIAKYLSHIISCPEDLRNQD